MLVVSLLFLFQSVDSKSEESDLCIYCHYKLELSTEFLKCYVDEKYKKPITFNKLNSHTMNKLTEIYKN